MDRIVFHIDVNSAYLSWEAVARLKAGETVDLREIPAAVGGDIETRHGVILAKSIPAKKYGVTTGEPVVDALRKYFLWEKQRSAGSGHWASARLGIWHTRIRRSFRAC